MCHNASDNNLSYEKKYTPCYRVYFSSGTSGELEKAESRKVIVLLPLNIYAIHKRKGPFKPSKYSNHLCCSVLNYNQGPLSTEPHEKILKEETV